MHLVEPFDLEGAELRFGDRIVLAVALAAHRALHGEGRQLAPEVLARVLTASIRMEDQPRIRTSSELGHAQRVDHKGARHPVAHRKANDLATEQIDRHPHDRGTIKPGSGFKRHVGQFYYGANTGSAPRRQTDAPAGWATREAHARCPSSP